MELRGSSTKLIKSKSKIVNLKDNRKIQKFLRGDETEITEEELKLRKKKHFFNKLFYQKLCHLVAKITEF